MFVLTLIMFPVFALIAYACGDSDYDVGGVNSVSFYATKVGFKKAQLNVDVNTWGDVRNITYHYSGSNGWSASGSGEKDTKMVTGLTPETNYTFRLTGISFEKKVAHERCHTDKSGNCICSVTYTWESDSVGDVSTSFTTGTIDFPNAASMNKSFDWLTFKWDVTHLTNAEGREVAPPKVEIKRIQPNLHLNVSHPYISYKDISGVPTISHSGLEYKFYEEQSRSRQTEVLPKTSYTYWVKGTDMHGDTWEQDVTITTPHFETMVTKQDTTKVNSEFQWTQIKDRKNNKWGSTDQPREDVYFLIERVAIERSPNDKAIQESIDRQQKVKRKHYLVSNLELNTALNRLQYIDQQVFPAWTYKYKLTPFRNMPNEKDSASLNDAYLLKDTSDTNLNGIVEKNLYDTVKMFNPKEKLKGDTIDLTLAIKPLQVSSVSVKRDPTSGNIIVEWPADDKALLYEIRRYKGDSATGTPDFVLTTIHTKYIDEEARINSGIFDADMANNNSTYTYSVRPIRGEGDGVPMTGSLAMYKFVMPGPVAMSTPAPRADSKMYYSSRITWGMFPPESSLPKYPNVQKVIVERWEYNDKKGEWEVRMRKKVEPRTGYWEDKWILPGKRIKYRLYPWAEEWQAGAERETNESTAPDLTNNIPEPTISAYSTKGKIVATLEAEYSDTNALYYILIRTPSGQTKSLSVIKGQSVTLSTDKEGTYEVSGVIYNSFTNQKKASSSTSVYVSTF